MKLWLVSGCVALLLLSGCTRNDGSTPLQSAHSKSYAALHEGVSDGRRAANSSGPFEVSVRYNPAACECPPHEIYAWGRWQRVFLEGDATAKEPVDALRDDGSLAVAEIRGAFTGSPRPDDDGVVYPVFVLR